MKQYLYRAKKSSTDLREGILQAESEEEVIARVNEMGLVVVHIEESLEGVAPSSGQQQRAAGAVYRGACRFAVTRFYKQLGRVLVSGIPILQAMTLLSEQAENPRLKTVLEDVKEFLAEGHPMSSALMRHPEYFSPFDLALIESGELGGRLDEALKRIAVYRENQEKLSSKIRSAVAYPLFVVGAGAAAVVFLLSYVMPKFSEFFLNLGQELPLLTRILIQISQFSERNWWGILICVTVLSWIFKRSFEANAKQIGWHRFYLGLPKVGRLIRASELARFSRTMSLLLESGIPLLKALQTSLPVVANQAIRVDLETAYRGIKEGGSLSDSLRSSKYIPPFVVQLMRAGEESGRLQEALNDISDWYEQELQENAEILTKLLEPVLILVVGAILGLMVIALMLPVFSMSAAVS